MSVDESAAVVQTYVYFQAEKSLILHGKGFISSQEQEKERDECK